ncbi:MAG TPA: DUF5985 family protein [Thermoanaerobaculia bacterium]|nr:DUF5985 family protein [Thermoanaerobaculia bacterium]
MTEWMISGALAMGYLVAAMFFVRYWREARERLFAFFALAFLLLAAQRLLLPFIADDQIELAYTVRVVAFLMIIVGIVDKNRRK